MKKNEIVFPFQRHQLHNLLACPSLRLSFALKLLLCYLNEFCWFARMLGTGNFLDVMQCVSQVYVECLDAFMLPPFRR